MNSSASSSGRVFLIGATRNADLVDEDVLSCFDEQIEFPLPNTDLRARLLTAFLTGKKLGFSLADEVVALSKKFNGTCNAGDLARSVQTAEQRALTRAIRNGGPQHLRIELEDIEPLPNHRAHPEQ